MSMIDHKGSTRKPGPKAPIRARDGKYKRNGDKLFVHAVIDEAITDVETGVEFWKTIARNRHSKRGFSSEFMNRSG